METASMTKRVQDNHIMSLEEKRDFVKLIRRMNWLYAPILDELQQYLPISRSLLDVACGDGYLLELIHACNKTYKLHGLDIDSFFINEARKRYDFQFNLGDIYCLKDESEIVTCNLALHHFENPTSLIRRLMDCSTKALVISDQIRPSTEKDLISRLKRRSLIVGNRDVPFYEENERSSILEAYSRIEIEEIFSEIARSKANVSLKFVDNDYYERFVAVIEK